MPVTTASALFQSFIDLVYPPSCAACGDIIAGSGPQVCQSCLNRLAPLTEPFCMRCGAPVEFPNQKKCPECLPKARYTRARAIYDYNDETIRRLIHALKYDFQTALSAPLAERMHEGFLEQYSDVRIDAIVPVPLHPARRREREFNQAELLASVIVRESGIPMRSDLLHRQRHTAPQARLPTRKRLTNVIGAFAAKGSAQGLSILLVDDIYTTGSTLSEAAAALRAAGAQRVYALTLARSLLRRLHSL